MCIRDRNLTFALRGDVPSLTARAAMHPGTTSYRLGLMGSPSCAEEIGLETTIRLSVDTGNSLHVQTVSTAGSVDILRRCKRKTAGLSPEAALHHLLFTHEDVGRYETCYKTLPPLREVYKRQPPCGGLAPGSAPCQLRQFPHC